MSKSGLYAHFRSKLELQLATIATADDVFGQDVVAPARAAAPGSARVLALCDAFLSHVERGVFPGGCFFVAATAEMNVRPGPVRDRIAEFVSEWMQVIGAWARSDRTSTLPSSHSRRTPSSWPRTSPFRSLATRASSNGHAEVYASAYAPRPQPTSA